MAPGTGVVDLKGLDDVQVLGSWNFTLQADTPLYWLRCGRLDKYLMKFNVHSPCPSTCGIVLHAEADFGGTDGSSFWIERRTSDDGQRTKRYLLSGDGLDSRPIVTRQFPDSGDQPEEIEVLMQGYFGVIMVQNRKVHLKFRCKRNKGSIAFYNTTQGEKDDVHFSEVRITALRRGPMEIGGFLGQRERQMLGRDREDPSATVQDEDNVGLRSEDAGNPGSRLTTTSRPTPSHRQASSTLLSPSSTGKRFRTPGSQHQSSDVLQRSASDVVLKSGSMKSTRFASTGKTGKTGHARWIPLAKNAPASEKQLIRDSMPKLPASKESCQDFIAMPL